MKAHWNKAALALAAVLAAAATLPARAEGLYVGGSLGTPNYRDDINGVSGSSNSGVSGKVFGGYEFTPNFALEAGAVKLGHIDNDAGSVRGHSYYLDAVGTLPLAANWSLLGRLGVAQSKVETPLGDDRGTGLKYGAGVQYDISKTIAVRGEWENYRLAVFDGHPNVHEYTVGVKVNF
jgi:OmpA-OmpF porin, OOP family